MRNFKREIFEQLGNLFYTLASDQEVPPMASGELKMLLKKDWLTEPQHISEDQVSEASHIIGLTIDTLQATKTPPPEVFSSFSAFYTEHQEQFSAALKQKVMHSAEAIIEIFPSAKPNAHLEELRILFSQTPESSGYAELAKTGLPRTE